MAGLFASSHRESTFTKTDGTLTGLARSLHSHSRSDIFSFGALLYEMVSGARAFDGETIPQVLSAVLRDDPPSLWPPSPLEPVIRRCLAKQPRDRFQTMDEVTGALEAVVLGPMKLVWPARRRGRRARTPMASLTEQLGSHAVGPDLRALGPSR